MKAVVARVLFGKLHDISMFHKIRNNRKLRGHSNKWQDVFMLEPLPPNNLSGKQLGLRRE